MIGMLLGLGAAGVPPPPPIAFDEGFALPPSPNTHLLAPPGAALPAHERFGPWPVPPERLWQVVHEVASAQPRTFALASWPELRQSQWVARTRLMNYPDIVVAQVVAGEGSGGLILYSRSLLGWSDLGANAARLAEWRAELERRLA